jgi:tetratricopeptide (TPR) repeat protein
MRVLRLAHRARTVGALIKEGAGSEPGRRDDVLRALDSLQVLGLLVLDGGGTEGSPAHGEGPEPTQEDARAVRLGAAYAAMESAHPVVVLELADRRRITDEDVANAYREISRRFHPDTFFNAPPAVRKLAEACFSAVNTAYEALRAPGGLAEARRFLEARAQGLAFVSEKDHIAGRVAFRRAEPLVRNRDWAAADALLVEALRLDPHTWPYALHGAWCGWLAKRLSWREAIAALDALTPTDPVRRAEVQVFAGNILKQEGRVEEAMARYRKALERQPDNRDAQRELRLHDLRKPPGSSSGATLLDGLLKRKKE